MRSTSRPFEGVLLAVVLLLLVAVSLSMSSCSSEESSQAGHQEDQPAQEEGSQGGKTRTYYIAADPVDWDFAPKGIDEITGKPFNEDEKVFVARGEHTIGKTYRKALYREYTDDSFSELRKRPEDQEYLGALGPLIKAEVGDTIKIVFKNNTDFPATIHPHGVFYKKDSEGAPYQDGTSGEQKGDDAVAPSEEHTYTWEVPERAGPGPMDPSSIAWMYHSHVDESDDTNTGLMGPMIVTRKGEAEEDGSPKGVDHEFFTLFTIYDENKSHYLDYNIEHFAGDPEGVDTEDEGFVESNLMHSINGYVFGNMPLMKMQKGDKVRWYLMGMGTEVDLHTPHWHGNTVTTGGMRADTVEVLPASMKVADMVPDNPGIWFFHCHVNDHIDAGMVARYSVEE
jgi:manganese oxidase